MLKVSDLSHSYGSDHEIGQLLLIFYCDANAAINFLAVFACRPILDAHDLYTRKMII